jgi:hypothetical protein
MFRSPAKPFNFKWLNVARLQSHDRQGVVIKASEAGSRSGRPMADSGPL